MFYVIKRGLFCTAGLSSLIIVIDACIDNASVIFQDSIIFYLSETEYLLTKLQLSFFSFSVL